MVIIKDASLLILSDFLSPASPRNYFFWLCSKALQIAVASSVSTVSVTYAVCLQLEYSSAIHRYLCYNFMVYELPLR